ncbi:MAG TPA: DUF6569 family protein [Pyrinomonadaceae bacterium]|nr:DUF6569 family protein [Pyrinomonadaceae bacterium]
MNLKRVFGVIAVLCLSALVALSQTPGYRISAPYSHKNLTIYLIHGKNETSKTNILTLQEAMDKGILRVYETSEVNELSVENISKQFDVFIQSGDIVKGGKQDRVLAVSIIIAARSGRIKIDSFCVESGRWEKRGNENAGQFSSSNDRIVSKELKLAANGTRSQTDVWNKVSEAQTKLGRNLGAPIVSSQSSSSLQLSLENGKVAATADEYVKALGNLVEGKSDVIGYAFAVNGELNSADIYVSNALFKKLWPRMLKAAAVEAVAEKSVRTVAAAPAKPTAVQEFLADADSARGEERAVSGGTRIVTRDQKDKAVYEARDEKSKTVVHRAYVKKH